MKILIVEDDELNAFALTTVLTHQNYVVEVAIDGNAAWDLIEIYDYDLILLDVMLPKLDGISLCRKIRAKGQKVPILLLTGCDSTHEKAIGLDAGADDYVVKPFDQEELVARIRALLRRGSTTTQPILEWGNLRLDPSSCEVIYAENLIALTPKEYALLELFLRNNRRVFSCGMILEHLWSYEDIPGEEAVRTHIKGLRQKLKTVGAASDLIETVYGIGYRLKPLSDELANKQELEQKAPSSSWKSQQQTVKTMVAKQTTEGIAKIWQQYRGRVDEQLQVLELAAETLAQSTNLNSELGWAILSQRQLHALQEAHTLAGSLGTFGFTFASELARKIEKLLKSDQSLNTKEVNSFQNWVKLLRQEIDDNSPETGLSFSNQPVTNRLSDDKELELIVPESISELIAVNQKLRSELIELQRRQAELIISQHRFEGILNIADDAIISIDSNQCITLFNQGAENIFGYSAQEIIGKSLDILLPRRFTDIHHQHVIDFGKSSSHARRMGERQELFACRQDGTEFAAEASISKLAIDNDYIYTVILRDITERKQIERMKNEFVSVVSHELRTPLTSIHASLGMLSSGLLSMDSESGKRLLEIAMDSTDRLVRLINDILDIERIESGKVKMERANCNALDLIASAINIMQSLANKAGVTLSVSSLSVALWVDSDRIVQTLTNLLSNAIKFSPVGATVWLTVKQQDTEVLFTVKDIGRGIPADQLDTIFERFQQVDSSDSRNHEGTGLGLAICKSIIQQHSGKIWVESVLGEGSIFYFTLPLFN